MTCLFRNRLMSNTTLTTAPPTTLVTKVSKTKTKPSKNKSSNIQIQGFVPCKSYVAPDHVRCLAVRNGNRSMTYAWYCRQPGVEAATKAERLNIPLQEGDMNTCDECAVKLPAGPKWPSFCIICESKVKLLQKQLEYELELR